MTEINLLKLKSGDFIVLRSGLLGEIESTEMVKPNLIKLTLTGSKESSLVYKLNGRSMDIFDAFDIVQVEST